MINLEQSTWTNEFGESLYRVHQKAENEKAAIGFVHGLGEHIHRYEHVFKYYLERGYSVFGYDAIGHGRSDGTRGHVRSLLQWMNEVNMLLTWMNENSDSPKALYGHSLGGFKTIAFCLQGGLLPDVAVATSPFLGEAKPSSAIKIAAGKTLSNVFPKLTIPNGLLIESISRDKQIIRDYLADKLVHAKMSLKMGSVTLSGAAWLMEGNNHQMPIPFLLEHGSADLITDFNSSKRFAEQIKGDVTWKNWDGGYHELHNDLNKTEMIEFTYNWINENLGF